MTNQALDNLASQQVIVLALESAHDRELLLIKAFMIGVEAGGVLAEVVADVTDSRHTEADRIALRVGRISLEVSMQAAAALRHCKFVIGTGEMVHADILVTRAA